MKKKEGDNIFKCINQLCAFKGEIHFNWWLYFDNQLYTCKKEYNQLDVSTDESLHIKEYNHMPWFFSL